MLLEDDVERASETEVARDLQRRWRCPAAGETPGPLDPDDLSPLAHNLGAALAAAERLGTKGCATCPRAVLESADPHLAEVVTAVVLCDEQKSLGLSEVLGRELTEADHRAVAALLLARRERRAWELDNPEKPKK